LLKDWLIKSRAVKKGLRGLDAERKERVMEVAVDCSKAGGASEVNEKAVSRFSKL
jgi:tellurite resistance protein